MCDEISFSSFVPGDFDADGVLDGDDNCPTIPNTTQDDTDGDGVGDACDDCPDTPFGHPVGPDGCVPPIPGDFDGDVDVDQADFGHFQMCYTGTGKPQTNPNCQDADLNGDDYADLDDFAIFQACMSGANNPGNPSCGN